MVKVIESMYRAPRFAVREKRKKSTERRQRTGIRQGCPLSCYLFIIALTALRIDIEKGMTEGERNIMTESQPTGAEGHDKLFYADDTNICKHSGGGGTDAQKDTEGICQVQYEIQPEELCALENEFDT